MHTFLIHASMLVAVLATMAAAAPVRSEVRYAVLHLENTTKEEVVYQLRWGAGAWKDEVKLLAGKRWYHWHTALGPNGQPNPRIRFKTGLNKGLDFKEYDLEANISASKDSGGNVYRFEKQKTAAGEDYIELHAVKFDPNLTGEKDRFKGNTILVDRKEALAALESFRLGQTLSPERLRELNELQGGEPIEDEKDAMSGDAKKLIAAERKRHDALQFEMVAAADMLLKAAAMSPNAREAMGWKLSWMFGPVTAPNSRAVSKDGLAGLRVVGRLDLPDGQQINAIFALKYYPPSDPNADVDGQVKLLSDVDNFRLEVRMFNQGKTITDFAHQSFSVAGDGRKMTMRPGLYVDQKTGKFSKKELVFPALGTSCINCHLAGPRLRADQVSLMQKKDYRAMEGFNDFLDQLKHWSADKKFRQKVEKAMAAQGPATFLPLKDMLRANREHWIAIYPQYLKRLKDPIKKNN